MTQTKSGSLYYNKNTNEKQIKRDILKNIFLAIEFGKATSFFQEYLDFQEAKEKGDFGRKNKIFGPNKNHALLSALFAYWWLPEEYNLFGYLIIKRHHGSVKDARDEFDLTDDYSVIEEQIQDIQKFSQKELENIYCLNLNEFFEFVNESNLKLIKNVFVKFGS